MNRLRGIAVLAIVAGLSTGGLVFAQDQGVRRRGPDGPGRGIGGPGGSAGVALRGVDLTDAQRDQIREIVERYQEQARTDIMLLLTPEQQERVKQNEAERAARMKQRAERRQQRQQNNN